MNPLVRKLLVGDSGEISPAYLGYRVFHLAWLVFLGLHWVLSIPEWSQIGGSFLQSGHPVMRVLSLVYAVGLVVSLFFPDRRLLFAAVLAFFVAAKIDALPFVPNHIFGALVIQGALLTALVMSARVHDAREGAARAYALFAPAVRAILILIYFFAVFHKLNVDFFDVEVSCGAVMYQELLGRVPILPDAIWAYRLSIYGTLAVETAIPVMLMIPALRGWGVALGLLFHVGLSLHPESYIFSFSAEAWALYALFLPGIWTRRLGESLVRQGNTKAVRRGSAAIVAAGVVGAGLYLATVAGGDGQFWQPLRRLAMLGRPAWYLWSLVVFVVVSALMIRGPRGGRLIAMTADAGRQRFILILFPILIVVNGLTPYLGLKTATNFSMFSNLLVIGERNNHWFMPSGILPLDEQSDLVEIVASTVPWLEEARRHNRRVPYFELRRLLGRARVDGMTVVFRRRGEVIDVSWPRNRDHEVFVPPSWLARKLLIFREVPAEGPCPCQW